MNFWTIIYIFNTCACLVTLISRTLMSKRYILSQFPNYYNKHSRASFTAKLFNYLALFFQCAIPVYHVALLLGLLVTWDRAMNNAIEKIKRENERV